MSRLVALLKAYRQRAGLSQNALAKRIGYDSAYICRVEAEKQAISRRVTEAVARVLCRDDYETMELMAAGGFWPWPDMPPLDALAMLAGGAPKGTEAA